MFVVKVLTEGATWSEDQLLVLTRNGFLEETYMTVCTIAKY